MSRIAVLFSLVFLVVFSVACSQADPTATSTTQADVSTPTPPAPTATLQPQELTVLTHDSFDIGEEVIAAFQDRYNATVSVVKAGDAGEVLNKSILSRGNPLGDVFYGIDNTFLTRALEEDIFLEYRSALLERVPEQYRLDPTNHVTPIDYGFVALNYDKQWLTDNGATPPATLQELTTPLWQGKLVVENPATSSPGLAFLIATVAEFGESGDYTYRDYWQDLKDNDVLVKDGWTEAYYGDFTPYGGDRPLVVSYTTSPAAEVFYSEGAYTEPPTGNVLGAGTAFLQIEGIGILRGTDNVELAQHFVDFALDLQFQQDFPTRMWVFPANAVAETPDVFAQFSEVPDSPASLDPARIAESRDTWIDEWAKVMLR